MTAREMLLFFGAMLVGYAIGAVVMWFLIRKRMLYVNNSIAMEDMGKPMCPHGYDWDDCPECRR